MTVLLLIGGGLYLLVGVGVWHGARRMLRRMPNVGRLAYVTTFVFSVAWPAAIIVGLVKTWYWRRQDRRWAREVSAALIRNLPESRPFPTHPDAAFGGQEHVRLCFSPDCPCRGHERDRPYDPREVEHPEDYWR